MKRYVTFHNAALKQTSNIVIFVWLPKFFWQRLMAHFCSGAPILSLAEKSKIFVLQKLALQFSSVSQNIFYQ